MYADGWTRRVYGRKGGLEAMAWELGLIFSGVEDPMDIVAALKREEAKFQKQIDALQQQLDTVRAAMKVLKGDRPISGKPAGRKKRVLSAAARAKISKASKERWAKFRAEKKKKEKA